MELAKQAAQGVERAMLDDDMFLVKGDTVGWKVRIYRNVADNYVEKIYIAGKITGDPNYKMKFRMAAKHIQELYPLAVILNPAELPEGLTPKDYMRLCFGMIDAADILFALPDAKESKGAKLEMAYCRYVGKGVLKWDD